MKASTSYHYRLIATNSAGMGLGDDQTFATLSAVSVDGYVLAYTTNNGTITIVSATGAGGPLTTPAIVTGLPVTVLDSGSFYGTPWTDISIPENVTTIGSHALRPHSRYHSRKRHQPVIAELGWLLPN